MSHSPPSQQPYANRRDEKRPGASASGRDHHHRTSLRTRPPHKSPRRPRYRYRDSSSSDTPSDAPSSHHSSPHSYSSSDSDYDYERRTRGSYPSSRQYDQRRHYPRDSHVNRRRPREKHDRDEYGRDRYRDSRERERYHDQRDAYQTSRYDRTRPDRDNYRNDRHDRDGYGREPYDRHRYTHDRREDARRDQPYQRDPHRTDHRQPKPQYQDRQSRDRGRESAYETDRRTRGREQSWRRASPPRHAHAEERRRDDPRALIHPTSERTRIHETPELLQSKPRQRGTREANADDGGANGKSQSGKPGKNETIWQRRRRIRENNQCSPIWERSPSPPRRLEDRFEVGADERKRKERKRQRKEERRSRREAKRARKAAKEAEKNPELDILSQPKPSEEGEKKAQEQIDSDDEELVVGPPLPPTKEKEKLDYGKALRPGEGSKMAVFVQDGSRIPRRGEIGLTSDQITSYEDQGYVMSGSRNRRMEAVRIRKENQVYSAEELAALSQFSREEHKAREERMMNHFRKLVESKRGEAPTIPARVNNDSSNQEE